jgi:hypothetical protein
MTERRRGPLPAEEKFDFGGPVNFLHNGVVTLAASESLVRIRLSQPGGPRNFAPLRSHWGNPHDASPSNANALPPRRRISRDDHQEMNR